VLFQVEAEPVSIGPRRLTDGEFRFCYERVPCLCIDFVIVKDGGILFAKREIEPFKGFWTLPGGILRRREPFDDAIARLLRVELGVTCVNKKLFDCIHHINDGDFRSSVSLAFLIKYEGELQGSDQGREFRYLSDFSDPKIQPYQAKFFRENPLV